MSEERLPKNEVYRISDLNQIKVLADRLRIRLLEGFCRERTTKQVADLIGEKPTRLYHHVEALERVGLIELSRTRQNRGTLEKYYLAVARTFQADSRLFSRSDEGEHDETAALRTMVSSIWDKTRSEMLALIDSGKAQEGLEEEGILSHIEIEASDQELRELYERLKGVLEEILQLDDEQADGGEPRRRFRLTLAYFPLAADRE